MTEQTFEPKNATKIQKPKLSWLGRLRLCAYRLMPTFITTPYDAFELSIARSRDDQKNEISTPPDDDRSKVYCFWVVEFYAPSHIPGLIAAFEKLGWTRDQRTASRADPASWLESIRLRGGSGWMNLGILVPKGEATHPFFQSTETILPKNVKYGFAHLFAINSSLACVVVRFELKDDYEDVYDDALRARFRTERIKIKRGFQISNPESLKEQRIHEIRTEMRVQGIRWVSRNMPGLFSGSENQSYFPTCEFLIFEKSKEDLEKERIYSSRDSLGIKSYSDNWWSTRYSKLILTLSNAFQNERFPHAIYSIGRSDVLEIDMSSFGGHDKSSCLAFFETEFEEVIWRWACSALLDFYDTNLNKIRDSEFVGDSLLDPNQMLSKLRKITLDSLDANTILPDLTDSIQNDSIFCLEPLQFVQHSSRDKQTTLNLWTSIAGNLRHKAKRVLETDKILREFLLQQSNLAATSENIKIQRQIRVLTLIILILTILSIAQSLH